MHHNRPARALFSLPSLTGLALLAVVTLQVTGSAKASEFPAATGFLTLDDGRQTHEALLLESDINLQVQGLLASMTLTQRFNNQSAQWLEGRYQFPMPADATVRGLQITMGDRTINGVIKENEVAEHLYQAAAAAGEIASVVDLQRPNLFNIRVANIAPHEEIVVVLDIMLPVQFDDGQFSLSLPTTFTPRYSNESTPDTEALKTPVLPASVIRGPQLTLNARINGIEDAALIKSTSHALQRYRDQVSLKAVPMDRDVELAWSLSGDDEPQTLLYTSTHDGHRYVQLMMVPPEHVTESVAQPAMARELILVVDKSGSMAGQSMRAARAALQSALDGLVDRDRFNIIAFDDRLQALYSDSRPASRQNLSQARQFISQLDADGGTEMMPALTMALNGGRQALATPDRDQALRQIVFMTDGSVGYEHEMLEAIDARLNEARLFTIGIGSAPNQWFLSKAAELGRGSSLSITDTGMVQSTMIRLFDMLARPALTDIQVELDAGQVNFHPSVVPDLYSGEPLMLVGRISDAARQIKITGSRGGQLFQKTLQIPPETDPAPVNASAGLPPSMAQHWARSRIETLEDEQRRSLSRQEPGDGDDDLNEDEITTLALSHGLVSQYTSFVAVEQTRQRPATESLEDVQVANLMPAGNTMGIIGLPAGAAGSDTLTLFAAVSGLAGGACLFIRRRRHRGPSTSGAR